MKLDCAAKALKEAERLAREKRVIQAIVYREDGLFHIEDFNNEIKGQLIEKVHP